MPLTLVVLFAWAIIGSLLAWAFSKVAGRC